ncbi:serine/threonine protein phosphatase PrpC [Leptospira meyeri]|uniref:Serine/threonine protein phosphatase PrpC n=1 Tax=Leptospira meyeri TaxID=29508 RepID=A0A4V3HHP7_LEPME|nr:protein phosphatase 2C domain-containing protein [Leptospira meyeri]EKJ86180.1 stage II sporulation protein E [Leptospira meyeri serovar Hardjo str. Went 5]TDY66523.1 serine/threonine protein phosphatase PrpC [Leptospira meyeri]
MERKSVNSKPQNRKYVVESLMGISKNENQDNFLIIEEKDYSLFYVFDGVGSALNSKKATELSKEYILIHSNSHFNNGLFDFAKLMLETNSYLLNQGIPEVKTTYCSVCISLLNPNLIQYSSLGDSRIYIINPQYLKQITEDDRFSTNRNLLSKYLGMENLSLNDFYTENYNISNNEKILLCSDGFYNLMEQEKARSFEILSKQYLSSIKKNLFSFVINKNLDDSTFILIK